MDPTVKIALRGFSPAGVNRLDELMQRVRDNLERAAEEIRSVQ